MAREACAVISARCGEPIRATAARQAGWLLIEHRGPWGRDPLTDGRSIDPVVGRELKRRATEAGVRVLLIRQQSRSRSRGHRYYLAWTGSKAWLAAGHCARLEEEVDAPSGPEAGASGTKGGLAVLSHLASVPLIQEPTQGHIPVPRLMAFDLDR